jgi:glycosyltransferase involved in cell wall biosynthesis
VKKVRVLEIGPGNFRKSGLSIIVWSWYKKLDLNKFQVDFLSHHSPEQEDINYIISHGGGYIYCGSKNPVVKSVKKFFLSRKTAKREKYDCIHIHSSHSYGALFHYIAVRRYSRNIIIHSHSSSFNTSNPFKCALNAVCRKLLGKCHITRMACSDLAAQWMFPRQILIPQNYIKINNGIETSKFIFNMGERQKARSELHIENKFVIGHVGAFIYQKNHSFLIDVFYETYQKNHEAVLLLIGGGMLERKIKEKVHNLALDDSVIFYGPTQDVSRMYQAMDCFIFPSSFEGLGIVTIEAQAAGLKTLCSSTIPKEAQISDLLEYMPLSDSVEKWADKILTFNNGYIRRDMSQKIKDAGYDIETSAKQLEQIYLQLSTNNNRSIG